MLQMFFVEQTDLTEVLKTAAGLSCVALMLLSLLHLSSQYFFIGFPVRFKGCLHVII